MRISAEKVLLALLGYLNFRRGDGMVPAGEMNPDNFPERKILIRMNDACFFEGHVGNTESSPVWLLPQQAHPIHIFQFYIRMPKEQYHGVFQEPGFNLLGLGPHNHAQHTPDSVQIRIESDAYYLASQFEVLPQAWNIPLNHIYVAVPQGHTYQALLRSQKFEKDSKRYSSIYPGTPPSPERENTTDHHVHVRRMHRFLQGH